MTNPITRRISTLLLLVATISMAGCTTSQSGSGHVAGPYLGAGGGYTPG